MYRPCWHCEGKKYNPLECPDICQWGWDRRRLKEFEDLNLEPTEILALKQENERLKDTNKALESDNYNLDMNLTRLSEELDRLKAGQGNEALNADNICNALEEYRLSKTVSHFLNSGDCKHFRDGIEAAILLIREIAEEMKEDGRD